jgi:hypothetical protein
VQPERIFVGILLLAGFFWLRVRARRLTDAARGRALRGSILFLAPALIGGKWALERLPFGLYANLAIEALFIAAVLAAAGFVFMTPGKTDEPES